MSKFQVKSKFKQGDTVYVTHWLGDKLTIDKITIRVVRGELIGNTVFVYYLDDFRRVFYNDYCYKTLKGARIGLKKFINRIKKEKGLNICVI